MYNKCMKLSRTLFKSQKDSIFGLDRSTDRILRAGFACKESAGIYGLSPLGYKIFEQLTNLLDQCFQGYLSNEKLKTEVQKVSLPILQDKKYWIASGRDNAYGRETFRLENRDGQEFYLAPTAEESVVHMIKSFISSYKSLGIILYQMIHKYRDEARPRYGLVRNKEFIMMDAYSFDKNDYECQANYAQMYSLYSQFFSALNIDFVFAAAECGEVGGSFSQNAFVRSNIGEDELCLKIPWNEYAQHVLQAKTYDEMTALSRHIDAAGPYKYTVIEIGHIFNLGDKYSKSMNAKFTDENGQEQFYVMGCYGIGMTRLLQALLEDDGTFYKPLPAIVAPYSFHLISINRNDEAEIVYSQLNKMLRGNFQQPCLYDDREAQPGTKFHDADLIGIPNRIILGKTIEWQNKFTNSTQIFDSVQELIKAIAS